MEKRVSGFYRPELDALRFLAFFMVFTHHAFVAAYIDALPGLPWAVRIPAAIALGGQFGVDLFFVLSAYLITELLLREKKLCGRLDVKGFYVRRILRIWPLYFTFVLFCFALPAFSPVVFPTKAFIYFLLLSGNIYFSINGGFRSPVAPLWSISIEEQFYLVWPWAVRFASRIQLSAISLALILGAFCTRVFLLMHSAPRHAILFNSLTRMDAIGAGVLLAVLLNGRTFRIRAVWRAAGFLLAITCWALSTSVFHILGEVVSPIDGVMGYGCGTLGAILLFISFLGAPEDGLGFLTLKPIAYLGRISYGLYVVHQLVLETTKLLLVKGLGRDPLMTRFVLALLISVPVAAISYKWLESPFLTLKRRFEHIATSPTPAEVREPKPERGRIPLMTPPLSAPQPKNG